MLKSLEIRNYQSHRATSLAFHPGMNVITGTSDSGKSAIIRAMLWALKNRPSGESFKSWTAKEDDTVEVSLEFDNDWFTKSRTKGKNRYESDAGFYEALRSDVPEPIQQISNITDYNLQTQFQPYFMLQDSSGDRAKKLNELVGLDIIDRVFKKLNSKITIARQDITRVTAQISEHNEVLESLSELPSIESLINKLSNDIDTLSKLEGRANAVAELLDKLTDYDKQIKEQSKILKAEQKYTLLKGAIDTFQGFERRKNQLSSIIVNHRKVQQDLDADVEWLLVEKPYLVIMEKEKRWNDLNDRCGNVTKMLTLLEQQRLDIVFKNKGVNEQIDTYVDMLTQAGECPTCTSKVDKKMMVSIISKLKGV